MNNQPHILVIDDEVQILRALRTILTAKQFKVSVASRGEEGLALAAAQPPDLIILDINLPEAQTVDLIKSLRAEMTTPIILLTPPRLEENIIEAYKAGVDDYMLKPVSPSLFNAKVKVWLRRSWSAATYSMDPVKIRGMPWSMPDREKRSQVESLFRESPPKTTRERDPEQ